MAFNMGDQFKGLPMGDLIGGPLMAACDAQVRLANATASFIQQVGFRPRDAAAAQTLSDPTKFDESLLDVRTVAFKFTRPSQAVSPVNDGTANTTVPTETVELDVPLLAIVKIPALSINTVDITFDMEVKNSERTSESEDKKGSFSADASVGWGPFSLKVHVEGSVATHKENTRETDQSAKYHVEVRAEDKGMPEGLARVLDMMNSAIAPKTITQNPANNNSAPAQPGSAPMSASAPLEARRGADDVYRTDESGLDHDAARTQDDVETGTYRLTRVNNR